MSGWYARLKAQFWADVRREAFGGLVQETSKMLERCYGDRVIYSRGIPFGLRELDGSITPFGPAKSRAAADLRALERRA